jgi:nicotinate-nucleotide adenylyltransferase
VKKVGLYFGTFNPIHNGHIALGNYFIEYTDLDEVWFIVSPQNPFKLDQELLAENHRLEMVRLALENHPNLSYSDIEFDLPKPSYTIKTLRFLIKKEAAITFALLMGEDNLVYFDQWKEFESILKLVDLYVYPRKHQNEIPESLLKHPKIELVPAPKLDFASRDIRKILSRGGEAKSLIPAQIVTYLEENKFYQ